jgi:hypothetical protein
MAVEKHNRSEDTRPSEVAHRQSYVRGVNEGAVELPQDGDADEVTILCECGRPDCLTTLQLNGEVYRSVRRQSTWFIVVDGHEVPEVGRVKQRRGTWTIVESTYSPNGTEAYSYNGLPGTEAARNLELVTAKGRGSPSG